MNQSCGYCLNLANFSTSFQKNSCQNWMQYFNNGLTSSVDRSYNSVSPGCFPLIHLRTGLVLNQSCMPRAQAHQKPQALFNVTALIITCSQPAPMTCGPYSQTHDPACVHIKSPDVQIVIKPSNSYTTEASGAALSSWSNNICLVADLTVCGHVLIVLFAT